MVIIHVLDQGVMVELQLIEWAGEHLVILVIGLLLRSGLWITTEGLVGLMLVRDRLIAKHASSEPSVVVLNHLLWRLEKLIATFISWASKKSHSSHVLWRL